MRQKIIINFIINWQDEWRSAATVAVTTGRISKKVWSVDQFTRRHFQKQLLIAHYSFSNKGGMEDSQKYADEMQELFRQRKLRISQLPIEDLKILILALQRHKSECTEAIATFKALFLRRGEIQFSEDQSLLLEGIYYKMVKQSKNKADIRRFQTLISKLRRLKSYSFERTFTSYIIEEESKSPEKEFIRKSMEINCRQIEKIMKEDQQSYFQLIKKLISEGRVDVVKIPTENLFSFIEWLREKKHRLAQQVQTMLAYKQEALYISTEEELQKNKVVLEGLYHEKVDQNFDKEQALQWKQLLSKLEEMSHDDFEDGLYILGDILEQLKENKCSIKKAYQLFRERRLAVHKMPLADLDWLIQGMERFQGEDVETIEILKMVRSRKKQAVLQEDHSASLKQIFCWRFYCEKNNKEAYRYFQWFEDMKVLKKEDFEDGEYILNQPYSSDEEEKEKKRNIREAIFEVVHIMDKDFREFTFLLLFLIKNNRLCLTRIPLRDMNRFLSGLKQFAKQQIIWIERMEMQIAFKNIKLFPEAKLKKHKDFLNKLYQRKVVHNYDSKNTCFWSGQFNILENMPKQNFYDAPYIGGLISERYLARELLSCSENIEEIDKEQNLTIVEMTVCICWNKQHLLKKDSYVQFAKEKLETLKGGQKLHVQNYQVYPCIDVEQNVVSRKIRFQLIDQKLID